ncbi:MAG: hypothetical protein MSG77_04950 [Prevotella sp.]|nr:hypothetical protein [Prevotella sp.]
MAEDFKYIRFKVIKVNRLKDLYKQLNDLKQFRYELLQWYGNTDDVTNA